MKKILLYILLPIITVCCDSNYTITMPDGPCDGYGCFERIFFIPNALYFGAQGGTNSIRASKAVWCFSPAIRIDSQIYYMHDSKYRPAPDEHCECCTDSVGTDIYVDTSSYNVVSLRILNLEHSWFSVRRITESSFVISVKPNDTKQERSFRLWVPPSGNTTNGGFIVTQAAE